MPTLKAVKPFVLAQRAWVTSGALFKLLLTGRGGGKALDVETPIPTPNGWRTMGVLEVGDKVFDEQGLPTVVTFVSDVQIGNECFEVTFDDGSNVVADAEHLWLTSDASERTDSKDPQVRSTLNIADTLETEHSVASSHKHWMIHSVQPVTTRPVRCIQVDSPSHLYLAGRSCIPTHNTVAGVFEVRRYVKRHAGAIVVCTEPTYGMVRDILKREFDRQMRAAGEGGHVVWRAGEFKYLWPNGSEIWLRQCDQPEPHRGETIAAAWMDEAAMSPLQAFRLLSPCLRQEGYPHVFWFTSTPRGKNWLYWLFTEGTRPKESPAYLGAAGGLNGEVVKFVMSALDNPHLDETTKTTLLAAYPPGTLGYRQEVAGEVVSFEGLVYPQFDIEKHVKEPAKTVTFVRTVGAMDWGWTNPGVALVLSLDTEDRIWVRAEVYESERDVSGWWVAACKGLQKRYEIDGWYCDPSEPEHIAALQQAGAPAYSGNNERVPGITEVASRIAKDKLLVTPGCGNTIRELGLYVWKTTRQGDIRPDEPEKADDHCMDALRYGSMALAVPSFEPEYVELF